MPKTKNRCALWTNDVETHSIYHNTLRDSTGEKVLKEGMPLLLDLYDRHNIQSTFFFTGYIAERFPDVVRMIQPFGHEVACHSYSHDPKDALDRLTQSKQKEAVTRSKRILEDISGQEVVGFRAPALRVNSLTPQVLLEAGYVYDSSIASQRFDLFLSFGMREKLKWLAAPRKPYMVSDKGLHRRGALPLIEVPLSAMLFPYLSTTMRIFPKQTRAVRMAIQFESRLTGKPVVFDTHPNEFIEEADEPFEMTRRADTMLGYIMGDVVRRRMKLKNLGVNGLPLYEEQLRYFERRGFKSMTVKQYVDDTFELS